MYGVVVIWKSEFAIFRIDNLLGLGCRLVVHQFEFCCAAATSLPARKDGRPLQEQLHCGFVEASSSRDLRDGKGDFARKLSHYLPVAHLAFRWSR
jgi:hypothetical protein